MRTLKVIQASTLDIMLDSDLIFKLDSEVDTPQYKSTYIKEIAGTKNYFANTLIDKLKEYTEHGNWLTVEFEF
ncbi:MAG: hypothetical protein Q9M76_05940 [Candidatus Dojkabacteria bacterium]|nr:hypothetical protein [Candidatus Dojkabacteria bacterium]